MARFKLKEVKKEKRVELRLSAAEKELLENEAYLLCLDLSEYLLRCALSKPIHLDNMSHIGVKLLHIVYKQREIWQIDKSQEGLQRLIMNAVADAISDLPSRLTNKEPQLYLPLDNGKKDKRVSMRLLEEDWTKVKKKAEENQSNLSEFILLKALSRPKSPKVISVIESRLTEFESMLKDFMTHSLLKSPIYLTVQQKLLDYVKLIVLDFHNERYVRTESRLTRKRSGNI